MYVVMAVKIIPISSTGHNIVHVPTPAARIATISLTLAAKEAYEEAGIAPGLAREAVPCGQLTIRRMQRDGLHHDTIHVHDLELPPSFVPVNQDGEVAEFRLLTPAEAAAIAATSEGGDAMTPDASLVVADWLLRTGEVAADSAAGATLSALRHAS